MKNGLPTWANKDVNRCIKKDIRETIISNLLTTAENALLKTCASKFNVLRLVLSFTNKIYLAACV